MQVNYVKLLHWLYCTSYLSCLSYLGIAACLQKYNYKKYVQNAKFKFTNQNVRFQLTVYDDEDWFVMANKDIRTLSKIYNYTYNNIYKTHRYTKQ